MSTRKEDPRDPSQEVTLTFPKTWYQESSDGLNSSGMLLSGLIMVTRNRFLAWPAVIFTLNTVFNQHPARSRGDVSTWSNLMLCISALFASYIPMVIVSRSPAPPPIAWNNLNLSQWTKQSFASSPSNLPMHNRNVWGNFHPGFWLQSWWNLE